jgi:hypothetical protein
LTTARNVRNKSQSGSDLAMHICISDRVKYAISQATVSRDTGPS